MKFLKTYIVLGLVILFISQISFTESVRSRARVQLKASINAKSNLTTNSTQAINIENYLNYGTSMLNQGHDPLKDTSSLLGMKKIFDNDMDMKKKFYGSAILSLEPFRSAINRNISHFNPEEMKKNTQIGLEGRYKVPVGSYPYKQAVDHLFRKVHKTHIFSDTVGRLKLTMNHLKNYPNLDKQFLKEAHDVFYGSPNKKTPNHTIADLINDRETIQKAIKFFYEFGTDSIVQAVFGFRFGFYQEYKSNNTISRDGKGGFIRPTIHNMTAASAKFKQVETKSTEGGEKNDQSGSIGINETNANNLTGGNNTTPDMNQFYIGKCTIDNFYLKPETCDINDLQLIKVELQPISYLFNNLLQFKKDFSVGEEIIDAEKINTIYNNMEFLRKEIQFALDPNLFVVTKFETHKLEIKKASKDVDCLKTHLPVMKKIYHDFQEVSKNHFFEEEEYAAEQNLPVVTIKHYGTLKDDKHFIKNGDAGMFWCLTKSHNIHVDELLNGNWTTNKYLTDMKFIQDFDVKSFEETGYECKETWEFVDSKKKQTARYYLCLKWTDNFMSPRIITDVKIFEFHPKMYKCNDKFLTTYIDGKNYECDCEFNFKNVSDTKKQDDTFMCWSRKTNLFYQPIIPNEPKTREEKTRQQA